MSRTNRALVIAALVVAVVGIILVFVSAFNTDAQNRKPPVHGVPQVGDLRPGLPEEQVMPYRGFYVHCYLLESGYAGDRTCDWIRFYDEHPEFLHHAR